MKKQEKLKKTGFEPGIRREIQKKLLKWYDRQKRQMPWRETRDPYKIWVSEIMLQQTQVKTVIPYYENFLKEFPGIPALANAPLNKVLKAWEGLGYYARARNLHKAAQLLRDTNKNKFPQTYDEIIALPGIGKYTAGAIGSIAFGLKVPILDGNVIRVLTRLAGIEADFRLPKVNAELWALSESLLPEKRIGDFNQSLMELGAIICMPANPLCSECPLRSLCLAKQANKTDSIPYRKKARKLPHYTIAAGIIRKKDKILISQRPLKGLLGGLWEFPGGKLEEGETLPECLQRELKEELDIEVKVGKLFKVVDHGYSHYTVTLHFFKCTFLSGQPKKLQVHDFKWVRPEEMREYAFPGADQPVVESLLKEIQS
jgi:A/G-specific adenine glycosylase